MKKILFTESQIKKVIDNLISEQENKKIYRIPGDNTWTYAVINNNWYTHKNTWNEDRWFKLSGNKYFHDAVYKLDRQFPDARYKEQVSGVPLKNTPSNKESTEYKRDFNNQQSWNTSGAIKNRY